MFSVNTLSRRARRLPNVCGGRAGGVGVGVPGVGLAGRGRGGGVGVGAHAGEVEQRLGGASLLAAAAVRVLVARAPRYHEVGGRRQL